MRRSRLLYWTIAFSTVALSGAIIAIAGSGCNQETPPPIQSLPEPKAKPNDDDFKPPTAEETAKAMSIVDRAIKAHGGAERLARLKVQIQHLKGPVLVRDSYLSSEREMKTVFPSAIRLSVKLFEPSGNHESELFFDGKAGWEKSESGTLTEISPELCSNVLAEIEYMQILSLIPLKDGTYRMRPVTGIPVGRQETDAIQVQRKTGQLLNLYFDRQSGLLLRTYGPHTELRVQQTREVLFSDHKSFDGLMLPTHFTDKRDGSAVYPENTVDYTFPPRIDPAEFAKPSK